MASTKKPKSLSDVFIHHNINYAQAPFDIIQTAKLSETLQNEIAFTLAEVPYKASEASICENLIYPLLKEAWKQYLDSFSIWSHQSLADNNGNLRIPDYLITKRSKLGYVIFDFPVLSVVQARKDNFTNGWTQCCLDMIRIRELNQKETMTVYGIVTNGEVWEFGKLEPQRFVLYRKRFVIEELDTLFNGLLSVLELCKQQLIELKLL